MQGRRWLRTIGKEPIVPFLMVGAALFGLQAWWSPQGSQANATIVVSDEQAAAMVQAFARTWQRPPHRRTFSVCSTTMCAPRCWCVKR